MADLPAAQPGAHLQLQSGSAGFSPRAWTEASRSFGGAGIGRFSSPPGMKSEIKGLF